MFYQLIVERSEVCNETVVEDSKLVTHYLIFQQYSIPLQQTCLAKFISQSLIKFVTVRLINDTRDLWMNSQLSIFVIERKYK
jgi:hypothetical protein